MDPQTLSLIQQLINQLSCINQNSTMPPCAVIPPLQKEIDEAGILPPIGTPSPSVESLRRNAVMAKEQAVFGDRARINYFCFLPTNSNQIFKVFGIDNHRQIIVAYDDVDINQSVTINGNTVDFSFIIPIQ